MYTFINCHQDQASDQYLATTSDTKWKKYSKNLVHIYGGQYLLYLNQWLVLKLCFVLK